MSLVSVVIPTYNATETIRESIESVLTQSFANFELIIVNDGSTDDTVSIIRSYQDPRILLFVNKHDFVGSLNLGLQQSQGKYIARMDADDIMHRDRLKIQYAIMEEEPSITVCSTWMLPFGEKVSAGSIAQTGFGIIKQPLIQMLKGNPIFHPTVMIRKEFLDMNHLQYEPYPCAEDYKLWMEVAKWGGLFFIESQPLLNYRVSNKQVSQAKQEEQNATSNTIKREILEYLIDNSKINNPEIAEIYKNLIVLREKGLIKPTDIFAFFHTLFMKNKNELFSSKVYSK